jgi:hypothetical protein
MPSSTREDFVCPTDTDHAERLAELKQR